MSREKLLACDLDNTLIYSYQKKQPGDVCVEWLEGREQSFMSPKAYRLLRRVCAFLVPVTARSIAQYQRIRWPEGCTPAWAVTTNGGVLLRCGAVEEEWRQASLTASAPWHDELERIYAYLAAQGTYRSCRIVDGLYTFAACETAEQAAAQSSILCGETSLTVEVSGRKLYFLPPALHKGAALERLRCRMDARFVYCAGDSVMDVPMLCAADLAIVPDAALAAQVKGVPTAVCGADRRFEEFVLETALDAE